MKRIRLIAGLLALITASAIAWLSRAEPAPAPVAPAPSKAPIEETMAPSVTSSAPDETDVLSLAAATSTGAIKAEYIGNGRERFQATLRNTSDAPLGVRFSAGETFTNGRGSVVLLRDATLNVPEGGSASATLTTAAISSTAGVGESAYTVSSTTYPRLRPLLKYLAEHPEVTREAAQTAVLALTENLPVCAFAKFIPVGGEMDRVFNTTPFRVDVTDLISALSVLREIGVPDHELALTIDPQLKIEAMIDPLAHAAAMRYYGIPTAQEWAYWKNEITNGDIRTRHYALFGIARFFPEVALQMLPTWVREARTNEVFRQSALQALAETRRFEALSILNQLVLEFGAGTEMGELAQQCHAALDRQLSKTAAPAMAVAFRTSTDVTSL